MTEPAEIPQLRPPEEHAEGALDLPDGVQVLEGSPIGGRRGVAVLVSKFNGEITTRLLASALEELERAGVSRGVRDRRARYPGRSSCRSPRLRSRRPGASRASSRSAA